MLIKPLDHRIMRTSFFLSPELLEYFLNLSHEDSLPVEHRLIRDDINAPFKKGEILYVVYSLDYQDKETDDKEGEEDTLGIFEVDIMFRIELKRDASDKEMNRNLEEFINNTCHSILKNFVQNCLLHAISEQIYLP